MNIFADANCFLGDITDSTVIGTASYEFHQEPMYILIQLTSYMIM